MKNIILKNKQLLLSLIMGFSIYATLSFQKYIAHFNVLFLVVLVLLISYIYKSDLFNKKYTKLCISLSLFFAIFFLLGRICYNFRYNSIYNLWTEFFNLKSILYIGGYFSLFYTFFINITPKIDSIKVIKKFKIKKKINVFVCSSLIIFLCWIPYLLVYYPGFFTGDSISELRQIINNFVGLSDHHTVAHILFASIPFKIGMSIFNNVNIAASLISITQMIVMSTIFGYCINFLYKKGVNKKILIFVLGYFALVPIHGFYSITMWKDIIFSGCILLLSIELIKLLDKEKITIKNSYSFIIISILTVFFRNNAIYMYIILALVSLFVFRKQVKTMVVMLLIVFCVYGVIKGPVFNYFNVKTSSSKEYIAIPLQQIGRMAYKGVEFTNTEEELINELIPLETLKKVYNAEIVDSIKFNDNYNAEAFEKNKFEYLKMWASLCVKNFDIATEAYLMSTLGYWYPNIDYWTVVARIDKNEIELYDDSIFPDRIKNVTDKLTTKSIPIYSFIWSIGLCIWIIVISIAMILRNKDKRAIYVFTPVIGVWLTMMVATPVFAEFRYIYCAFTTLPILLLSSNLIKLSK